MALGKIASFGPPGLNPVRLAEDSPALGLPRKRGKKDDGRAHRLPVSLGMSHDISMDY